MIRWRHEAGAQEDELPQPDLGHRTVLLDFNHEHVDQPATR